MKSMAIILTVVALASPLAAHAANGKAAHFAQASGIAAQATGNVAEGCNCPPADDPDPYVVHG